MPKQPMQAKKKGKAKKKPPQRQLVYAGPPGLKEVLRKLQPPPEPEHVREGRRLLDRMLSGQIGDRATRRQRKPTERRGARLLSPDQIDRGTAHLDERLNDPKVKNPRRWWTQKSAAKEIAVYLGLPPESFQTVEDEIVIPLFDRRGLRRSKK